MEKTIYNIGLHEFISINSSLTVNRVPGGWNYIHHNSGVVFVPLNREFDKRKRGININKIITFTEEHFNLPTPIMETKTREGNYPLVRQIISKLLSNNTNLTKSGIAKLVNLKRGSDISNAIKSIDNRLSTDTKVYINYQYIKDRFNLK